MHQLRILMSIVDAGEAGEGNLEILVSAANSNIPTRVEPLGNARFGVSFVPKQPTHHLVYVTFNDEPVPGKSLTINTTSLKNADLSNLFVPF